MHPAKPRCIIIGAGIAGISAAIASIDAGYSPVVLEGKNYIGGRARSFTDTATGEILDNGQHVMMGCYERMLSIIARLGTHDSVMRQQSLQVVFRDTLGRVARFGPSRLPSSLGSLWSLLRLQHISLSSKFRAAVLIGALERGYHAPAEFTVHDLLEHFRQPADLVERFWEPFVIATLNADLHSSSARLLIEVLRRSIMAGDEMSALVIPRIGLHAMIEPFPSWVASNGGQLRLREYVDALCIENSICTGVHTRSGEFIPAEAVICAVPARAASSIRRSDASDEWAPVPDVLGRSSSIVSTYLWFDKPFMDEQLCAAIGTRTQWIFNRRKLSRASEETVKRFPGHLTLTTSAADDVAAHATDHIIERSLHDLHVLLPESSSARLLHAQVIKERHATPLLTPGAEASRPTAHTCFPNVVRCGDWTRTGLPATLEGAARSGVDAVDTLLAQRERHRVEGVG